MAFLAVLLVASFAPFALAAKPDVNTITEREIFYSAAHYLTGEAIPTGFDPYGYNYQGHMFSGSYFNVYAGGYGFPVWEGDDDAYYQRLVDEGFFADKESAKATATAGGGYWWAFPYREVTIIMKWNDAWLSNKDQDLDGKLDRHYGFPSYIGSGAWETNHQYGEYEVDGKIYKWNYFCKIVAVPEDAVIDSGIWYINAVEIGPAIWGEFAIIQEVINDQGTGDHGLYYVSPYKAGFGAYAP